jgi:hypothetical protein
MENKEIKKENNYTQACRRKYHIIYKTTCLITKRFYIGMHSTDNLEDGYLGSGKRLWYSLKKHGRENHVCEVLEVLPNRKDLAVREMEIVNDELLEKDLCMNLKVGGEGGGMIWSKEHRDSLTKGSKEYMKNVWKDEEYRKRASAQNSINVKKNHADGRMKYDNFKGKKHSEETILKMKESKRGHGIGSTNSQFGKCWITNDIESKKITKGDAIPEGWRLGRKI